MLYGNLVLLIKLKIRLNGFLMIIFIVCLLKKCLFLNNCFKIGINLKLLVMKVCVKGVMMVDFMVVFILGFIKYW